MSTSTIGPFLSDERLPLLFTTAILPHAQAVFDSALIEPGFLSHPILAKIYALFLAYSMGFLGCSRDLALLCADALSRGKEAGFSSDIVKNLAVYNLRWDDSRIRFADAPDSPPKTEDLPILFSIVIGDLQCAHATVYSSVLSKELIAFTRDLHGFLSTSKTPSAFQCSEPSAGGFAPTETASSSFDWRKDSAPSSLEDAEPSSPLPRAQSHAARKPFHFGNFLLSLFIVFGLVVCFLLFTGGINDFFSGSAPAPSSHAHTPSSSVSLKSTVPASSEAAVLTPVAKPSTGLKRAYDNAEARAPFDVTASDSQDFYLVLGENGKAARCYYIRHGETLSVSVPLGTYSLYYACAPYQSAWYGVDKLWGSDTEFYKSSDVWDFTIEDGYYVGYTLSLSLVSNGNTHSNETSEYTWDSLF